uniref:50S ribosomal protein L20 n=1 Tax=Monsonia speciosa TaxID=163694 RepID=B7T3T6_9ROSI|nr:ribosomal protein L20 [Monsonia speciosa]ACH47413.1 ribosomal protein L20 [Monsonia speciosa]ADJ66434.1 ribosomal protein L20 [Monsonia speciosa]
MSRTTRGPVAHRRRIKEKSIAAGGRGSHSTLSRVISQEILRAWNSGTRDRKRKKREFRCLWMVRINGGLRGNVVSFTYSKLISFLHKEEIVLNRKVLAQIGTLNEANFRALFAGS